MGSSVFQVRQSIIVSHSRSEVCYDVLSSSTPFVGMSSFHFLLVILSCLADVLYYGLLALLVKYVTYYSHYSQLLQSESVMLADKHKLEKEQNAQLRNQVAQLLQLEQEQKLEIQQQDSIIQTLQVGYIIYV